MRILAVVPALLLIGVALGGCNTGAPQGVLPRDPLPPPPSLNRNERSGPAAARQAGATAQRRAIDVPDRVETPRPSSPTIEPVMTGSGAGAGFRF